jgi:hypothetical protein
MISFFGNWMGRLGSGGAPRTIDRDPEKWEPAFGKIASNKEASALAVRSPRP